MEYDTKIQPELGTGDLSLMLVGRDLGRNEVKRRQPFVGQAGQLLDDALAEADIQRSKLLAITNVVQRRPPSNDFARHQGWAVEEGLEELHYLIERLDPDCIVALGNEASYALVKDWPTGGRGIFGAKGIQERRGYVWEHKLFGTPVVATVHPSFVNRSWVPWRMLLTADLRRAKMIATEGFERPEREVEVVA